MSDASEPGFLSILGVAVASVVVAEGVTAVIPSADPWVIALVAFLCLFVADGYRRTRE